MELQENILITVIMSTYREKIEDVKCSIESILNQSIKEIEFIREVLGLEA